MSTTLDTVTICCSTIVNGRYGIKRKFVNVDADGIQRTDLRDGRYGIAGICDTKKEFVKDEEFNVYDTTTG